MKNDLGARMKEQYEWRSRALLARRSYTIVRLDGAHFHTYTKGLEKPFDAQFHRDLVEAARYLCANAMGTQLAYVQSDEISLLLTDFATNQTQSWFNGNIQKIVSTSAALVTAKFNELRPNKIATFDSRAFIIPDPTEVNNYFVWRQQDATRNSIQLAGQHYFSQKQLDRVSCIQIQELLFSKHNVNWNDYPEWFRRGTVITPHLREHRLVYKHKTTQEPIVQEGVMRRIWEDEAAPIFTQVAWLQDHIPKYV